MPTLNEHSSEETAATEGIFNMHRCGAHWTRDLGFNVHIRQTCEIYRTKDVYITFYLCMCTSHTRKKKKKKTRWIIYS